MLWFSTIDGLNQLKNGHVTRYGMQGGSSNDAASSLFQDSQGRLRVASPRGSSYFQKGPFELITVGIPGFGYVSAITQDREGNLWVSDQRLGLFELSGAGGVVTRLPWTEFQGAARALAVDPADGGVWLGLFQGGVSYLKNGRIQQSYGNVDGLGEGKVSSLVFDRQGALWAATQGG